MIVKARQSIMQKGSFAVITQKCNKTANINVKKTAVYSQVNDE